MLLDTKPKCFVKNNADKNSSMQNILTERKLQFYNAPNLKTLYVYVLFCYTLKHRSQLGCENKSYVEWKNVILALFKDIACYSISIF